MYLPINQSNIRLRQTPVFTSSVHFITKSSFYVLLQWEEGDRLICNGIFINTFGLLLWIIYRRSSMEFIREILIECIICQIQPQVAYFLGFFVILTVLSQQRYKPAYGTIDISISRKWYIGIQGYGAGYTGIELTFIFYILFVSMAIYLVIWHTRGFRYEMHAGKLELATRTSDFALTLVFTKCSAQPKVSWHRSIYEKDICIEQKTKCVIYKVC